MVESWKNSPRALILPLCGIFAIMGLILGYTYFIYLPSPWNLSVTVSQGRMQPAELVISRGARVFITVFAHEDHSLSIPDLNIEITVPGGGKTTVDFVAEKIGIYPIRALSPSSRLAGTLTIVEPGYGSTEHAHG